MSCRVMTKGLEESDIDWNTVVQYVQSRQRNLEL
jgi:hypothetical protein